MKTHVYAVEIRWKWGWKWNELTQPRCLWCSNSNGFIRIQIWIQSTQRWYDQCRKTKKFANINDHETLGHGPEHLKKQETNEIFELFALILWNTALSEQTWGKMRRNVLTCWIPFASAAFVPWKMWNFDLIFSLVWDSMWVRFIYLFRNKLSVT